jgi:hypothetical protein
VNQTLAEQANRSFNLTSPALRGERRSGAVKRAPQVNSNPLACVKKVLMKILICFIMLSVSAIAQENGAPEYSTPEETLKSYFAALQKGDTAALWKCFEVDEKRYNISGPMAVSNYRIVTKTVFSKQKLKGSKFPLVGDVELLVDYKLVKQTFSVLLYLRKHGREWKIVDEISPTPDQ